MARLHNARLHITATVACLGEPVGVQAVERNGHEPAAGGGSRRSGEASERWGLLLRSLRPIQRRAAPSGTQVSDC